MQPDTLERLNAKLGALLALALDAHLREAGARGRTRSAERLLKDAGLSTSEIASLLGKTDRAVRLQLQKEAPRRLGSKR